MNKITLNPRHILLSLAFGLAAIANTAFAQTPGGGTVSGEVSDEDGLSLPGVSVQIKGTNQGTTCDENGKYSLNVSDDAVLVFSFIGMNTEEIPVNGRAIINVTMTTDAMMLDEVVAIGYGKQSRTLVTNSISRVSSEEFLRAPGQNPLMQLQGKVPGLSLEISSGQPGADPTVFIRGGSSTSPEGDTPLIIVDGVISQGFRSISDMNPADIEDIVVLKDAASTAIYGARAANGILLVTTKSGQKGKAKVNLRYTFGIEQRPQRLPLLDARDYIYLTRSNTAKFNTPELTINPPEYYAKEARDFLNQYYLTPIIVKFDSVSDRRDRYGRLLAYIYDDTSFDSINWRILYYGYGYFYGLFAFEAEKMEEFKIAETDARINKRGLWNE